MAGDWIKMRGNLWDDPRVSKLCDLTDQSEAAIVGALYWLWAAADQHTEDGLMPGLTLRQIDRKTGVQGFGAALCQIGWLEDNPDGVRIVNFEDHNGTSAKRRCTDAQRKANVRNVSASDADKQRTESGQKTPNLGAREEKRREEEKKEIQAQAPLPDWLPMEAWSGYVEMRKRIRKQMTPRAQQLVLKSLADMQAKGLSVAQSLDNSTRNSWVDVYEPKEQPEQAGAKRGTDEYAALHRNAAWWRDAGFESVWDAINAKCWHDNADKFRDGKRVEVAA